MSEKESSRSLIEQEAGTNGKNLDGDFSCLDGNIETGARQRIFDLLPRGEGNAVSSKELAQMVGVTSVRELQHRIAAEREAGALILSTCRGGYYRPQNGAAGQAEISRFVATLRSRALNTLRVLRAAKAALAQAEGQMTLLNWGDCND